MDHIKATYIHFSNCFNRHLRKDNMFPAWYYTNMQIVTNYHHTTINFQEKQVKIDDQEDDINIERHTPIVASLANPMNVTNHLNTQQQKHILPTPIYVDNSKVFNHKYHPTSEGSQREICVAFNLQPHNEVSFGNLFVLQIKTISTANQWYKQYDQKPFVSVRKDKKTNR